MASPMDHNMPDTASQLKDDGNAGLAEGSDTRDTSESPTPPPRDARFWLIILGLLVATFLSALDLTAVSTALPTIAASLRSQDYTWIGNAYSIAACAFVPWSGGLANVFGRRPILLGGLASFAVGSAMCGAAPDMNVMLAGRTFQGLGSGIILSLVEIVLADLVPLSERGAFQGAFGAVWALASATGPPIGGGMASSNWRWLFYMNLPLTAGVAAVVIAFMHLKTPEGTMKEKLVQMDWLGNAIFIPSITIFIIGLSWGGQSYPWVSSHVLAPLILGGVGLLIWFFVERTVKHPTVPFNLLSNRTTVIGFLTTFIHGIPSLALFYYWPVYFQAVKGNTPIQSSVKFFPICFTVAPFAMVAGGSISALQIYKPQNIVAWILMTVGPGLVTLIHATSSAKLWIPLPIPWSIGLGLLYAATVFPVLAPLPPSLAGQALAFLVFIRSFGNILGITVGSTTLANELRRRLPQEWLSQVPGGIPGAYAAIPTIKYLAEPLRTEVRQAFAESLRVIWIVLIPFGGIGLVLAVAMKSLKLETVTDESWGMKDRKTKSDATEDASKITDL